MRMHKRILRGLLRLYPTEFRRRYGEDMLRTFEAYSRTRSDGLRFWAVIVPDVIISAMREHASAPGSTHRMLGLMGMLGGLLWFVLHTPIGLRWFPMPAFGLILLGGAVFAAYLISGDGHQMGRLGFALTAAGLAITLAGYIAAWYFGWQQSGVPTLVGAALQSAGLLMLSGSAEGYGPSRRLSYFTILLGVLNAILALWLLMFLLLAGTPIGAFVAGWGLIVLGMLSGMLWTALGYTLWSSGDEVLQVA